MPKILCIRFSSIGDIVLASPVFRCLKLQMKDAEVHLVTKASFKPVTVHNPYIDKFFYFDDNLPDIITRLKPEGYDYVIDLHNNFRSIKIKKSLGVKYYTIKKLSLAKELLTRFKINVMPQRHITLRSLDTVSALGVRDDGLGLDYFIDDAEKTSLNDIPTSHHAGYVAVVIGASYATKKLPVQQLIKLCEGIKHPIILLGGNEDFPAGAEVAAADAVKIYNACGKFSLNESADLVRKSKLVISHDTGLLYIACAFNKPSFAIWGATSPALQVEPFYGTSMQTKDLYKNFSLNLWCQPCSKYGGKKCPLGHFNCMKKQDINLIAEEAEKWIRG